MVAQDTPEEVVGSGRNPVTQVEHIVEYEHDGRTEQRVDDSDDDEPDDRTVQLEFHGINGAFCGRSVSTRGASCAASAGYR